MERIGIYEWTVVLIGMGTVFIALIGLSLILGVFSLFARFRKNKVSGAAKEDALDMPETSAPCAESSPAAPSSSGITPELVAVLTAAISAASGRDASELRIARISPAATGISGLNTPVWGYANRLASGRR